MMHRVLGDSHGWGVEINASGLQGWGVLVLFSPVLVKKSDVNVTPSNNNETLHRDIVVD